MDNYEELDSFTEEMIKRTQLRQLALNNCANDCLNGSTSSSSTETPVTYIDEADGEESEHSNDEKDTSVVSSDSSSNKRHMSSTSVDTTAVSEESESPPKKRMSLNSRLSSISKMIDESSNGKSKIGEKCAPNDSGVKSKACVDALNDLSDKKRAPLRDRLNAMARMYTSDDQFEYEPTKQIETYTKSPQKKSANVFSISTANKSPMKKSTPLAKSGDNGRVERSPHINDNKNKNENVSTVESNKKNNCTPKNNYFAAKLTLTNNSANGKKDTTDKNIVNNNTNENQTEKKSSNASNEINNKTFIVATDKKIPVENIREMSAKSTAIVNSPKVITTPVNVSDVRKRFEAKSDSKPNNIIIKKPEILSVTAKTDLFEKAILAECDAKSKMYDRKRITPQPYKQNKINNTPKPYNNLINSNISSPQPILSEETSIKRVPQPILSEEKSIKTVPQPILSEETSIKRVLSSSEDTFEAMCGVSDNIATRTKILQQMLLMGTTTANAVSSDVEMRKKELDLLKRPIRRKLSLEDVAKSNDKKDEMISNNQSEINAKITCDKKRDEEQEHVDHRNDTVDDSIDSENAHQTICDAFDDIDKYVLEDMSPAMSIKSSKIGNSCNTTPNNEIDSTKFEFESPTKRNRLYPDLVTLDECHAIHESPPPSKPPRAAGDSCYNLKPITPLRTISFYRKEQQMKGSNNTTPVVQTIVYGQKEKPKSSNNDMNRIKLNEIQDKIRKLTEDVQNQNRITGQASQALALCLEKEEFKGSMERVEAEKLLLESGQKRIAYLNEIKRLNDLLSSPEKTLLKSEKSKGCLSLSNIQLSVNGEFLVKRAEQRDSHVYHYICIIYNKANVYVTNVLNSVEHIKNGALEFYFGFSMPDLAADFQVGIHVYEMATPKQSVSHETKYHIKKTPKKGKRNMHSPAIRSPGGPSAVLSTSFSLVGKVNLNIRNWNRKSMILENFNPNSKLAGSIATHMSLKVIHDYKAEGFLNLSNSSGCWSQRWFVLRRNLLAYWRFPDDMNKEPLGGIDLMDCINPKVCTVSREVCSRKNTFSLITLPIIENKSRNGGSIRRGNTPIGYLLSTDIKEECTEWCDRLTELLESIRLWETGCAIPISEEDFDNCLKYANFSN